MICQHCGHPVGWHGEDGVCRPVVMTDASQGRGVVRPAPCTYGCRRPVYP